MTAELRRKESQQFEVGKLITRFNKNVALLQRYFTVTSYEYVQKRRKLT
ncbi:hypothetical protein SAMN04487996_12012 [Dyadobacter soli]|uniref:Uncharacterized protein n=1 Tax=Dyadobacter soli TaxID=659014 RepID=A0A1G7V9W7_9BACT|nr:hypothetical protein SAMN04487996_12012 [Dyadobacter soli]